MIDIQKNLADIQTHIRQCEKIFNRKPGSVSLLAVSKKQSIEKIEQAIAAGQIAFGENYLQEALTKITVLSSKNIEWHFIGPIQRNKTRKIAENFQWVHSIDDALIAQRLNDQRPQDLPPLNICIQVNVSSELTKSGVNLDEVEALANYCVTLPRLKLRGLMTIPTSKCHFDEQRKEFHKLQIIAENLIKKGFPLDTLSMGMSEDMDAAIAEHATIVRIGTKLFGSRG